MTEKELKEWFFDKFNSCYAVNHSLYPYSIFWFYDKSYIRKKKLSIINNRELLLPTTVNGICLFELDFKNDWFNCDRYEIWNFLECNYSTSYDYIQSLINSCLKDIDKSSIFTSRVSYDITTNELKNIDNLSVLNSHIMYDRISPIVLNSDKNEVHLLNNIL